MANPKCGALPDQAPIGKLGLKAHLTTILQFGKIHTISDLTDLCACELLDIHEMTWPLMEEIIDALHDADLHLNTECRVQRQ